MIIAGHCANELWKHDGAQIGFTSVNTMMGGGTPYADAQRVPVSASLGNLIYVKDSVKARPITSFRGTQLNGDSVCASGVTSDYRCGVITNASLWYCVDPLPGGISSPCFWGIQAGSASDPLGSDHGDSGGPVFINNTALGIVSAMDGPNRTVYGEIDYVFASVSVRLCLDSSCS